MKRKIIEIDEAKCNGCGLCIPNCPEGALQVIDGKARLVSDLFCDGLGACLGECPQGAIQSIEREAEPYDERKVMANIVRQGEHTIVAHLKHLKNHGEHELYKIAVEYLEEQHIPLPQDMTASTKLPCGCPGTLAKKLHSVSAVDLPSGGSALQQWPVQLKLLNPAAAYFDNADLLVAADCTAFAHGAFHRNFLTGKILVVFCPKLDSDTESYVEKLKEIFLKHDIRSITIVKMEVPCCGGMVVIVKRALAASGKKIKLEIKTLGLDGQIQ